MITNQERKQLAEELGWHKRLTEHEMCKILNEEDTGYFDTTKCECGYLNDVSATYCGQCGGIIKVVE